MTKLIVALRKFAKAPKKAMAHLAQNTPLVYTANDVVVIVPWLAVHAVPNLLLQFSTHNIVFTVHLFN